MIEKPETAEFTAPPASPAPEPVPQETPPEPPKPTAEELLVARLAALEARTGRIEDRVDALEALSSTTETTASEPPIGGPTSGFWECLNPKCSNARPTPNAEPTLFAGPVQAAAREAVVCPACGGGQVIYAHDAPTEDGGKE